MRREGGGVGGRGEERGPSRRRRKRKRRRKKERKVRGRGWMRKGMEREQEWQFLWSRAQQVEYDFHLAEALELSFVFYSLVLRQWLYWIRERGCHYVTTHNSTECCRTNHEASLARQIIRLTCRDRGLMEQSLVTSPSVSQETATGIRSVEDPNALKMVKLWTSPLTIILSCSWLCKLHSIKGNKEPISSYKEVISPKEDIADQSSSLVPLASGPIKVPPEAMPFTSSANQPQMAKNIAKTFSK
ncbi:hypothetical protein PoB_002209000 [Plakobranchus ocellatus]|uniref:Uncharacterized protein n=1 Tax=Plakobranchus ocellatus TaxID=259542 RepID=A0AAV3ZIW6_9GAST|nr:hypothetical protein PoB_002209000 [Plakobranchus ocellatus]